MIVKVWLPTFSVYTSDFLTLEGRCHPAYPCVPSIQLKTVIVWCTEPNDILRQKIVARGAQAAQSLGQHPGSPWGVEESVFTLMENLLLCLISRSQCPWQPDVSITTFQMTQQSLQMFK